MQHRLRQQSYFVQEEFPDGLLTGMVEHFLGTTDFENFRDFRRNKRNGNKLSNWTSCTSLAWFLDYLETSLGAKYFTAQLGFPFLQGRKTGTGLHCDRSQAIFDPAGENIIQCWIPVWERNMPDSGLRIYPCFVNGEQVYGDDTYREFVKAKPKNKPGRETVKRYIIPEDVVKPDPVDFGARDNLWKVIWFNTNCLHQTLKAHDPDLSKDQSRIAISIRFVRENCPLRPGFTLQDLHKITKDEPLRTVVEQRYF